jgi:hypothetical protein
MSDPYNPHDPQQQQQQQPQQPPAPQQPPPPPPAYHVKAPDPSKAAKLRASHANDAQQAELAAQMAAQRRVPRYEAGEQKLGGGRTAGSPEDVAAQRVQKLGKSKVGNQKMAKHIQAEEIRKAEAARKRVEDEERLAKARERGDLLKASRAAVPSADPRAAAAAAEARITPNRLRQILVLIEGEALELLRKVVVNICQEPTKAKLRSLRRHNPPLRALFADAHALSVLRFAGFVEAQVDENDNGVLESFLILPMEASTEALQQVSDSLSGRAGGAASPAPSEAAARQQPQQRGGGVRGMAGSSAGGAAPPPPDGLVCPITNDLMSDPVMTAKGNTYERRAIKDWFARCRAEGRPLTDPKSGSTVDSDALVPNNNVRSMASDYLEEQQASRLRQREEAAVAAGTVPLDIADPPPPQADAAPARARGDAGPYNDQMRKLEEMGFVDREMNLTVLEAAEGNLEVAMGMLCV